MRILKVYDYDMLHVGCVEKTQCAQDTLMPVTVGGKGLAWGDHRHHIIELLP